MCREINLSKDHKVLNTSVGQAQIFPQESSEEIAGKGTFENPEKSSEFSISKCSKTKQLGVTECVVKFRT